MGPETKSHLAPAPPGERKRLNAKVILFALAAICAAGVGLAALDRGMRLRRDRQTIEWAERAMQEGQYEAAAAQFARAVSRHPDDADLSLRSGDAFYAMSAAKPEALQGARVAWEAAARIRPKDPRPLNRLLCFQADLAEVRPTAASFRQLGDIAERLAAVSPSDEGAAIARTIARLGPWFSDAGPGDAAERGAHERVVDALDDSMRQGQPGERAVLYYALACARRAVELGEDGGGNASAHQVLDRAEREIVQAGERDARMRYRAAEGLAILAEANQRLDQTVTPPDAFAGRSKGAATAGPAAGTQPAVATAASPQSVWPTWDSLAHRVMWAGDDADAAQSGLQRSGSPTTRPVSGASARCLRAARSFAARAAAAATPSDPRLVDIRLLEVHLAQADDDVRAAEQICRDTLAANPNSLRARLALAGLWGGSRPAEAMALLDYPAKPEDAGPGPVALARRGLLIEASMRRAQLHLDAAASSADSAARQTDMQKANDACEAMVAMLVNSPASLKLTARLRMLQGRYAQAIRLLDSAARMDQAQGIGDVDLLAFRATAFLALHEPQAATESLQAVLAADPSRAPARLLLARTLLDEGRVSEAADQVDRLQKQIANDPRMAELRVRLLIVREANDPDEATAHQVHQAYWELAEATATQRLAKAELALAAGEAADALRLLRAAHEAEPSSVPLIVKLARSLIASNRRDEAKGLLADALRERPGEVALLAARKSLEGPTSPEAYERSINGGDAKEFLAAVHACRAAMDAHELVRAKMQLDAMARLRPDEPLFFDLKFRYDLAAEQWGDAGACSDRLAQANLDCVEGLSYAFLLKMARGQFFAATSVARQITQRYASFAAGWIDLGEAHKSLGRYDQAIDSFRHALALEADDLRAIKGLAACFQAAGRPSEADPWIASGRRLAPDDAGLRELEFVRQLAQGDPRRLIQPCEAAMRAEPQRPDDVVRLARVYLRLSALRSLADPGEARDALKTASDVLGRAVKKWPDDAACAFWAAHAAALAGDVAGGKQALRRLCDQDAWSQRPEAAQLLAEFCLIWGDLRSSEAAVRDAIARGGASGALATRRLASLLIRQGAWQAALDALQACPADPLAQQQRVAIFVATGRSAAIGKELTTAQTADPTNARLMTLLGMLHAATNDDSGARAWLERAVAAGDEALACRVRGDLRLRDGTAGATHDLAIAREANFSDAGAALLLSDACLRDHDPAGAARVLQGALTIAPTDKDLRLRLIALEQEARATNWQRVEALIEAGRLLAPSDLDWDAAEARMWMSRHDPAKAAALMRHAVRLAETTPEVADATLEQQGANRLRALIPEELWMMLAAQAHAAADAVADEVIARYGPNDILTAWAHHAKAAVQRRTGREDLGAAEYVDAIATAQAAGGFGAAAAMVETISAEAGADEAIEHINAYVAAADGGARRSDNGGRAVPLAHDARWDLLRIDLLMRNGETRAAGAEIDKLMTRLSALPPDGQIELLRMAVVIGLQGPSTSQSDKALSACAALLQRLPDDAWALNNMAVCCIEMSPPAEPRQALEYGLRAYRAAARGGTVDPQIADTYGWALANAGRADEAIAVLTPVAARLVIPDVQYHLAEAYLAAGNPQAAWPHLAAAIRLAARDDQRGQRVNAHLRWHIGCAVWRAMRDTVVRGLADCSRPDRAGVIRASGGG